MKKLKLMIACLAIATSTNAQTFKAVEVDFPSLGYASSGDAGSGIQLPIEVRYNINDKMSAGLQFQWAFMVNADLEAAGLSISATGNSSVVFDYYLSANAFRPFVGLGAGSYSYVYTGVDTSSALTGGSIETGLRKIGIAPRIGFEFKHLRMMAEYNAVLGTADAALGSASYNPSYLAVKIALTIGGGRKD
jgi:outer membrane protein W